MMFRQGVIEIVFKAWSCFKNILWNCPDHAISRHIQNHTFNHRLTDGGTDKFDHLNGDSLSGTTVKCHNLLNNLVANHYEKKSERATPSKATTANFKTIETQIDTLVKVDQFIFPTNFVSLDIEVDSEIPIILRRLFLATGRILIDVQKDQQITFNVFKAMKFSNDSDKCFSVSVNDGLAGKEAIVERPLDFLERAFLDLVDDDNEENIEALKGIETLERTTLSKILKPSIEEPPTLELKPLPNHLYYAYLGEFDMLPIIFSSLLSNVQVEELLEYSGTTKVSPVQCMPNKGKITVVSKMHNELIPTRTVTGWRVGMDYRKLNKATRNDHFPLPFIDQMLNRLRCMMAIFTDIIENFLGVFMNDFFVYENSFDECLNHLSLMLKRCEETNLVLNWEKGIQVDKAKLETTEKLPPPILVKGIHSFLAHAAFYRCFIKEFSKISKSLCNLLEKDVPFKFDDACIHAFNKLEGKLVFAPIITAFPFELMCDVSDLAIGAVLGQQKDKIFRSIYYASKTFNDAQLNYMTTEKELLVVMFAFDKFRSYLV
ncbi:DNA-directed DNA polymerase [Handroanthus impetiginosus]|uniref:DNA-directed DNA polymerase n=1 Tax=Handroanthus impetiginosus TaxID=429701 RepID=A0A2G9GZL8_9LAMI|nr:DNA-directed DNA polymerase [Handroanthus impetiginosus]